MALDAGTTVAALADLLPGGPTVVTHSVPVIQTCTERGDVELIALAGAYHGATCSFTGPMTRASIADLAVDVAVLSATAAVPAGVRPLSRNREFAALWIDQTIPESGTLVSVASPGAAPAGQPATVGWCSAQEMWAHGSSSTHIAPPCPSTDFCTWTCPSPVRRRCPRRDR